jgi:hypothetical protein
MQAPKSYQEAPLAVRSRGFPASAIPIDMDEDKYARAKHRMAARRRAYERRRQLGILLLLVMLIGVGLLFGWW